MSIGFKAESAASQTVERCRELALCSDVLGKTTRTFLSPATLSAHALVSGWMRGAGMAVSTDAAGNIRGLLAASSSDAPRLIIGSHLDTVANAGAFDGPLGVILGIALVQAIAEDSKAAMRPFEIEVVGFSEEEGVRFSRPFLGSLALTGELDAASLACTDPAGITIAQAICSFGLNPEDLPAARIAPSSFAYLEFHIEQGPVLECQGFGLAVVDAIAGQTRMEFVFTGQANHAGTTPMGSLRRDALAAAAQWIVEVERYAGAHRGLVATVARIDSSSAAANVIAGRCMTSLDVRHADDRQRNAAAQHLIESAHTAAATRGVSVSHTTSTDQPAVPMARYLSALLAAAALRATGVEPPHITSGAGHDAMIVARRIPAAMLFLRSPGGLSHHPDEAVLPGDVAAAFATGLEFLRGLRDDRAMLERIAAQAASSEAEPDA